MNATYIVGTFDVAELAFLLFFLFFIGLVVYLNRESRREGYPLEEELGGRVDQAGKKLSDNGDKVFKLPHGRGEYIPENVARDPVDVPGTRTFGSAGAPYVPDGDAMKSGMGPGAYAKRATYPDLTADGRPRIVPIGAAHEIAIAPMDDDPVGLPVYDADKKLAGKVSDVWVDQSEHIIRYLEITTNSGKQVLAPIFVAKVQGKGLLLGDLTPLVDIDAITAEQFDDVPTLATPGQITRDEEERVSAYYGGGYLYAKPERAEPWI
ncbi:MAG: photosynthetic reaction center subunit H [Pseudomonadota bacterium]